MNACIMRFKFARMVGFFIVFINVIMVYYTLRLFISFNNLKKANSSQVLVKPPTKSPYPTIKHLSKLITVVIRDFELYENDVTLTAQSFLNVFPNIQLYILFNDLPYPPLDITLSNNTLPNVKLINLSPNLQKPLADSYPVFQIKTKYVLFVPDSTRITSRQSLHTMLTERIKHAADIITAPVNSYKKDAKCLRVNVNAREWSIKYSSLKGTQCDAVTGKHLTLVETELLTKLPNAFLMPFPHSFYVQTAVRNQKVKMLKGVSFHDGKPVLKSHHAQWKHRQTQSSRLKHLYDAFQIKQVLRETGATEWYGCNRDTPRCFGTVLESMPSYLYAGKWTPPCCLANLRKTARHVFNVLDEAGVRYWLEAGSLLGAMRSNDILPWDHDVDVGFNRDDLARCVWLDKAKNKPVLDSKGFLWEKATEGNFYRVHYSKVNRIFVNLFPFYAKNGTMVKDSWFTNHKNMEFPDNFLHPMSSIEFIGRSVPSPNNIRDFLELKFGKGAIETAEYPDPSKLKFS